MCIKHIKVMIKKSQETTSIKGRVSELENTLVEIMQAGSGYYK